MHFLQFFADFCKKCKSVKAIYIYISECFHDTLSENDIVYRVWATIQEILEIKIWKKMLT